MEPAISRLLAGPLLAIGVPEGAVRPVGSVTAIVIATLLSMIVGELVPKNFALALPRQTAKVVIPFQWLFTTVFRPAIRVLNGTANRILRAMGIDPKEGLSGARTAEELSSLVRRSAQHGLLEAGTATLLSRTLAFSQLTAQDVMTPRPRIESVERGDSAVDIIELARRTGHSRFPVVGESFDEYGGTAGVATLEDLVEELVGEVADEHDRAVVDVVRARDWLTFPGILRPDELADRAGVTVPEDGPWETVAGWLMAELGRLPRVGDTVQIDAGVFRVERLDGRRIDRVRFTPVAVDAPSAGGAL